MDFKITTEPMKLSSLLQHNIPHLANLLAPKANEFDHNALFQDILLLQYRAILLSQVWTESSAWTSKNLYQVFPTKKPWQNSELWNNERFLLLGAALPFPKYSISELFPKNLQPNHSDFILDWHQNHERILGTELSCDDSGYWQLQSSMQSTRKKTGSFYTPVELVQIIIEQLLLDVDLRLSTLPIAQQEAYLLSLRCCDPSCGTGNFLLHLTQILAGRLQKIRMQCGQDTRFNDCLKTISHHCIFGTDLNWLSVGLCRLGLWWQCQDSELSSNFRIGDALLGWIDTKNAFSWKKEFPEIFQSGGFDIVLGNPPYVDSKTMKKQDPALRTRYQKGFNSTKGNWDLYIPFSELGLLLLKPDGIVAFLTPKNILGADYAKALQAIWLEQQILWIQDFSAQDWFEDAKVSVVAIACKKQTAIQNQAIQCLRYRPDSIQTISTTTQELLRLPPGYISFPFSAQNREQIHWLKHPALLTIATCSDGSSTTEAYQIRELVEEGSEKDRRDPEKIKLLITGTIDPFERLWGRKKCRYLGYQGFYPVIQSAVFKKKHPRRWTQAMTPKLVIAGLAAKIEAVVAPPPFLCGKTTIQVIPQEGICLDALTCYLNSATIFSFYKAIFAMRGFSPRSFLIGPRQLERLPIPAKEYFTQWNIKEPITAQKQLSYWGQHPEKIHSEKLAVFILALLSVN